MAGDRRWHLGTVRVRTTVAATLVVGVALAVGALLLVGVLRRNLTDNIETAARLRGRDVAALLAAGTTPDKLAVDSDEASLIQVIDPNGKVVAASANVHGEPPIADLRPGSARTVTRLPIGEGGSYRVAAATASTPQGRYVVLSARSLQPADDGVAAVAAGLGAGLPLLLLLVAVTTWVVTGRSLRPVEAIRTEVTTINEAELDRRVPEPAGDDEVARLARTMNAMLARLEASRDRQQRFVSDASHELRSPIATMRHELEILISDPGAADIVEVAQGLLDEDLRMQALVDDLLVLARSDEGTLALTRRPVDVDDLVLTEATRLRSRGLVRIDATGVSAGRVMGDQAQLGRVVRNLIDNAERHASATVRLALTAVNGRVVLTVADDGPGIAPADRARIFERFTRLDQARARRTGGYGLGLAIVHQVVTAHHGSVRVEETPGGGATFTVDLPGAQP